jgi:hypothetical protein
MHIRKPSPATLIALLALFVALGGSSYAALQLPTGSVGTKQLKNGAVTSEKVRNNSLVVRDFRASQRALLRGPRGLQGLQGVRGERGERGEQGLPGAQGPPGPFPGTLPSGATVRGAYSVGGTAAANNNFFSDAISFGFALASAPTPHFIPLAGPTSPDCPGSAGNSRSQPRPPLYLRGQSSQRRGGRLQRSGHGFKRQHGQILGRRGRRALQCGRRFDGARLLGGDRPVAV